MFINYKTDFKGKEYLHSGQALLIVLLVMAVALTVVLSSVGRSITDISISEVEEESSRAFSAAEAGVEQALLDLDTYGTGSYTVGDATVNVNTEFQEIKNNDYRYPEKLESGEEAIIWFVDHDTSDQLNCGEDNNCFDKNHLSELCWGDPTKTYTTGVNGNTPAIVFTLYYDYVDPSNPPNGWDTSSKVFWLQEGGNFSNIKIETVGFDPDEDRRSVNGFNGLEDGTNARTTTHHYCNIGGTDYKFEMNGNIMFSNFDFDDGCVGEEGCLIMAKIRMLYNDGPEEFAFTIPAMGNKLTSQGIEIGSTGVVEETQRKVLVFRSFPEPLEIFTGAVFSRDGLEHE